MPEYIITKKYDNYYPKIKYNCNGCDVEVQIVNQENGFGFTDIKTAKKVLKNIKAHDEEVKQLTKEKVVFKL